LDFGLRLKHKHRRSRNPKSAIRNQCHVAVKRRDKLEFYKSIGKVTFANIRQRNLVLLAVALASELLVRFVLDGKKRDYSATLRDFSFAELER
jgi:hypothetical protein